MNKWDSYILTSTSLELYFQSIFTFKMKYYVW